jgi:hypothetical protein
MERYCIALPKPTRKPIPALGYFVTKHHGFMSLLEGYCSCPKLFNTLAIPLAMYPKNTLGSITYLLKLGGGKLIQFATLPYPSMFHGECKYPKMIQVLHLNSICLFK